MLMDDVSDLRIALQELSELRRRVYSTTQLSTVSRACQNLVEYCAQKPDPLLDGFGEANPWKRSAHKSEQDASKRSRDIEQSIIPANRVNIVCLAAPESGFDEILRQINLNRTFATTELDEYKRYLKRNLLTVLRYVTKHAIPTLSDSNQKLYKKLLCDEHGTNFDGIMTSSVADALRSLWTDPAVQNAYNSITPSTFITNLIGNLTVDGIVKYVDHLQDPSFTPTPMDAAHFFNRTTGLREVHVQSDLTDKHIHLLDLTNLPVVGEGDFCKHSWISLFQSCNFVFCYIPLHSYDEKIGQDLSNSAGITTNQTTQQSNQHGTSKLTKTTSSDSVAIKPTPLSHLLKSNSMGSSLPNATSTKSSPLGIDLRTRSNSTNAKYSPAPKLHLKTVQSQPNQNNNSNPTIEITKSTNDDGEDTTPTRESTLPPQVTGFDVPNEQLSPKRKSHYRNSMIAKPSTTNNFVKRTVPEKKNKSLHVAASHRFHSPSVSPTGSPLTPARSPPSSPPITTSPPSSPQLVTSPSPPLVKSPSPPLVHSPSPPSLAKSPSPPSPSLTTSPSPPPLASSPSPPSPNSSSVSLNHSHSGSPTRTRKANASFLIINNSPPPSPTVAPSRIHSNSLLAPLKIGHRKSWDNLLAPLDRIRANTSSLVPNPSASTSPPSSFRKSTSPPSSYRESSTSPTSSFRKESSTSPPSSFRKESSTSPPSSFRKSERSSVSYGSIPPLSLVALPASPTLADIFKLPCYLKRFSALINEEFLLHIPVLVTLVVTPKFSEKLKDVDLDVCFPEYEGDHTEQSALDFIKKIFTEQNSNPMRKIITVILPTADDNDPTNEVRSILTNAIGAQLLY